MRVLLVDLNNLVARNSFAFPNAQTSEGFPIGGMYGSIMQLRTFLGREPHDAVIGAIDFGVPKFRKEICPEYKAQRADNRTAEDEKRYKAYKQQTDVIHKVMNPCGVTTVRAKGWEGDDVIAALVRYRLTKHKVTILSSDRDFLQLIDGERVLMWDLGRDEWREPDPYHCMKRCIDPKQSDNLDGVTGIGPKKADKVIQDWIDYATDKEGRAKGTDLEGFLAWCKANAEGNKLANAVHAQAQKVRANWKCTYLAGTAEECNEALKFRRADPDKKVLKSVCVEYQLRPLLEDMSSLWPAFVGLKRSV